MRTHTTNNTASGKPLYQFKQPSITNHPVIIILKKQLSYTIVAGVVVTALVPITISLNSLNSISEQIISQSLRVQAAPGSKTTTKIKEFTWLTNETTALGDHTLTIAATDKEGNITTKDIIITVVEENITISDVVITPNEQDADIVWQTKKKNTAPHVDYDVSSTFRKSTDGGVTTKGKSHSIKLAKLLPCTTYAIRIKATGTKTEKQDSIRTFTTKGCVGDAAVEGIAREDVTTTQGGTATLTDKIAVAVPAGFAAANANFQVKQLARDTALNTIGTPEELSPVTGLYDLAAYTDAATRLSDFNQPISVTVKYTPAENTDLSTLALYRHNGTDWSTLDDCAIDEDNQNITCTTTSFSQVAGFAGGDQSSEPAPEPSPTPAPAGSDDGGGGDGGDGGDGGGGGGEEEAQPAPTPKKTVKSKGQATPVPLYKLNSIIRRILGNQFVTPDIHSYYVYRLQLRSNERGYIKSTTHLANIMKYWQAVRPTKPRGEKTASTSTKQTTVSVSSLNSVIRRILGPSFVTPDIHSYYLKRLNTSKTSRAYISSLQKLESVMNYWKFVRPLRPRGD